MILPKIKTLYVWPEGVFSGYSYEEIQNLRQFFLNNFSKNHFILFGVNRLDKRMNRFYNSLIIVDNQMEIIQEYKKMKLVPFGEFLPFESFLSQIGFKKLTEGHGSFLSGKSQNNLTIDKLHILPLICYEIIFTNLIQSSNQNNTGC